MEVRGAVARSLHEHWVLYLIEGVVLIVLGATAIVLPPIATLAVTILIGWLLLVSGIMGLLMVVANIGRARAGSRRAAYGIAAARRGLVDHRAGGFLYYRRHRLDHVRARS
jgi:uncharacterized membrane protein HdeD (DUF308 family)